MRPNVPGNFSVYFLLSFFLSQLDLDQEVESAAYPPELCVICLMEPRNASFIHERTGHQVCCIAFAEREEESKERPHTTVKNMTS